MFKGLSKCQQGTLSCISLVNTRDLTKYSYKINYKGAQWLSGRVLD